MRWFSDLEYVWRLTWFIVLTTLIPLSLGVWLDDRWGTVPFFTLIGVIGGVALAVVGVRRLLR